MKIQITESKLKKIIAESIKNILTENIKDESIVRSLKDVVSDEQYNDPKWRKGIMKMISKEHPQFHPGKEHFTFNSNKEIVHDETPNMKDEKFDDVWRQNQAKERKELPVHPQKSRNGWILPFKRLASSEDINKYLESQYGIDERYDAFLENFKNENGGQLPEWGKFNFSKVNFRNEIEQWDNNTLKEFLQTAKDNYWGAKIGNKIFKVYYSPAYCKENGRVKVGAAYDAMHNENVWRLHIADHCVNGKFVTIDY